jgi:hypothetical protein
MNRGEHDNDGWTQRLIALEETMEYRWLEAGRRYWWAMFQQAEAEGHPDQNHYWREAHGYAKALKEMREAVR